MKKGCLIIISIILAILASPFIFHYTLKAWSAISDRWYSSEMIDSIYADMVSIYEKEHRFPSPEETFGFLRKAKCEPTYENGSNEPFTPNMKELQIGYCLLKGESIRVTMGFDYIEPDNRNSKYPYDITFSIRSTDCTLEFRRDDRELIYSNKYCATTGPFSNLFNQR